MSYCYASEKHREFYKNAKYVSKYNKSLKQQSQQNALPSTTTTQEDEDEQDLSYPMPSSAEARGSNPQLNLNKTMENS
ncbi:hypothetical protein SLE2022_244040 [Rubroshorea leprosula]